jgi:hypothetical protein
VLVCGVGMSTESGQPKPIVPETPGRFPAPHYTGGEYARHAALVKQINEWLLDNYCRQLIDTHHVLRDREQLLAKRGRELAEKEIQLRLAEQELAQLKNSSVLQFALSISSVLISGYGINLVTTTPSLEAGWVLIAIAVVLESISFFITYQARKRRDI